MRLAALVLTLSAPLLALDCNDGKNWGGDRARHCEMKEWTIAATPAVSVNAGPNGGVSVKGWAKNETLVRAKIETWAPEMNEAKALAGQIAVETAGGNIRANAPKFERDRGYSVSFEVFVPARTDLNLNSHNGGINVQEVTGAIRFETTNGGIKLSRLAGDVRGSTTNGGVSIELAGTRWDGAGLNVETTNGGVTVGVPEGYSAHFEAGTTNGGMQVDIPLRVRGEVGKKLQGDLGAGGAPIRVTTTNGGVKIRKIGA